MATIPWSIAAMCMVPTARTAREGKYETTAGVVKFAVGQSGSIVFLAPITTSLPAERYTLRAHLEREDPTQPNTFPSLLGTNIQLRRRRQTTGGVENVLVIAADQGASLLLGGGGVYAVDGPSEDFNDGIDVEKHFYWLQVEVQQQGPATAQTHNGVIGLELL
jgi:hypothetical protein